MKPWIVHVLSAAGLLRPLPTTDADLSPWLPFQEKPFPSFFLRCLGRQRALSFQKFGAALVQNAHEPLRDALFDFQNRADPQIELLPGDVLVASIEQAWPRNAAGLVVCTLSCQALELDRGVTHGKPFRPLQITFSQNPPGILDHSQYPALDLSHFALRWFQLWRKELTQRTVCICPPQPFGCRERILLIRGSSC